LLVGWIAAVVDDTKGRQAEVWERVNRKRIRKIFRYSLVNNNRFISVEFSLTLTFSLETKAVKVKVAQMKGRLSLKETC